MIEDIHRTEDLLGALNSLVQQLSSLISADLPRVESMLAALLTTTAHTPAATGTPPPEHHHRALLTNVRAFIDRHLHDPCLTPGSVAAAHHISVSHLHRLFQPTPHTVAGYIRHQRLEHIRRTLADPAHRSTPVHHIAAQWGIPQHAVFTRAFRNAYGLPPAEYRKRCRGTDSNSPVLHES